MKSDEDVYRWLENNSFILNGCEKIIETHYCTPDMKYMLLFKYGNIYIYYIDSGYYKWYYEYENIEDMKLSKDFHMYFRKSKLENFI
jgi:hypothetical protein